MKFSPYTQSGIRETTVFAGIGQCNERKRHRERKTETLRVLCAAGSLGPLDGNMKAVVSFTQANGQIVDVGAGVSASGK